MIEGIFLLLGSNLGDKKKLLETAIEKISEEIGMVVQKSGLYETAAWGKTDQPTFLNQVIEVTSKLSAEEILARVNGIEQALGRVRHEKWGARIIDIDILYYGQHVIASEELIVPHPGIPERRFTLAPLAEIAPDFIHPLLKKDNAHLLTHCPDKLEVRMIKS